MILVGKKKAERDTDNSERLEREWQKGRRNEKEMDKSNKLLGLKLVYI